MVMEASADSLGCLPAEGMSLEEESVFLDMLFFGMCMVGGVLFLIVSLLAGILSSARISHKKT